VIRKENAADRRMREAVVSPQGKAMTDRLDEARERMGRKIFDSWPQEDLDALVRLMRKFADGLEEREAQGD